MRNRRKLKRTPPPDPFWLSSEFQRWKDADRSSLIMVKGTFRDRFSVKDFCADLIELLRDAGVPVLWALKSVEESTTCYPSTLDILKSLVYQALRIDTTLKTEKSMASSFARFQGAVSENDWLNLLGSSLAAIPEIVIIVDVELLSPVSNIAKDFSMPTVFLRLFKGLAERDANTVRIILVSYGSKSFSTLNQHELRDIVLPLVKPSKGTASAQKKLRVYHGATGRVYGKLNKKCLRQAMAIRPR